MQTWKSAVNSVLSRSTGYIVTKDPRLPGQRAGQTVAAAPVAAPKPATATRAAKADAKSGRPSQEAFDAAVDRLSKAPLEQLSLTDIADLHGSDKGSLGPSVRWAGHRYTDVYEALFAPLRHQEVHLLEVGLGVPGENWDARIAHGRNAAGGASLKMWHDYFSRGRIVGADINPAPHLDNDRITTHVVDQSDPVALAGLLEAVGEGDFDIVVDDGSHRPDHQQITLGCLFDRVRPGGYYVIEDLLFNGIGSKRNDRMACHDVLSTRQSLKQWRIDGTFAGPHAIPDVDRVLDQIAELTFHVPRSGWKPDSESVVIIRKKG